MPIPVCGSPHLIDAFTQINFSWCFLVKIFPCTKEAHQQVRCLYNIGGVIQAIKSYGFTRSSIHEMRIDTMKTICIEEKVCDLSQPSYRGVTTNPFSFYRDDRTHDAKTCTTNRGCIRAEFCPAEVGFIPRFIDII